MCGKEFVSIVVKRTIFGQLMYALDAAYYQFNSDWASFFSVVSPDTATILFFALIILSFVCVYIDIKKTTVIAQEKADIIRRNRPAHKIQR
jgi:hypothetical protein